MAVLVSTGKAAGSRTKACSCSGVTVFPGRPLPKPATTDAFKEPSGSCQAHLARTTSSGSVGTEVHEEEEGRGRRGLLLLIQTSKGTSGLRMGMF